MVITPFFPSKESFVGSYIFDQVNEIRNQTNFNIQIIKAVSVFSSENDYKFKGFNVHIFKIIDFPYFIFPGIFNAINKFRFKDFISKNEIQNPEIIHAHVSYPSSYLISDFKCKTIVQHHGLDVLQLLNGRNNFLRNLQKSLVIKNTIRHLNKVDLNIGVSQLVLSQLAVYDHYHPKQEFVLYNGVDRSKFFPFLSDKQEVFTIGCVSNFWKIKDHMTLIKSVELALKNGRNILLRLIGSGPTLKICRNYVYDNNLSNSIIFESEIKHEELNKFYNKIDLFVLPSYYEALGCVYLESWATDTPFIAVEGQGISELIPNDKINDMLISRSDYVLLSEKIAFQMNHKSEFEFNDDLDIRNTISNFLSLNILA